MSITSAIRARYRKFDRLRREDGIATAVASSLKYVLAQPHRLLLLEPGTYQQGYRVDMEQRWEIISRHIDPTVHRNVLDIGCHQGELTRRASDLGLLAVGIDQGEIKLEEARRLTPRDRPCHFFRLRVTPENVDQLPAFDVVFLLSVYYHWGRVLGWDEAEEMLQTVSEKSDLLFFETPKDVNYISSDRLPTDEPPVEAVSSYLDEVIPERSIAYIGTTGYAGGARQDAIYLIT